MSEAHIIKAVLSFMNAATWDEAKRCVETWPEVLLTEAADKMLAEWLEQSQGNESVTCLLKERRALLARYRREGIGLASTDLLSSFSSPSQISATECLNLTCAQCERTFSAEVWVLVDASERPDLVERIRVSVLHNLACPSCGQTVVAHVPLLLLYFPEARRSYSSPQRAMSRPNSSTHRRAGWWTCSASDWGTSGEQHGEKKAPMSSSPAHSCSWYWTVIRKGLYAK